MIERIPEPELMDVPERADAYAGTDFSHVNEAFVARLLELSVDRPGVSAIDLGTGPGDVPFLVAQQRPGWRILGVDGSLPMLRHGAATSRRRRVHFVAADAKQLPLTDNSVDLVFSNSLLHHLPNPAPFWREVRRILRPRGLVFVRDLFRPETREDAQRLVDTYAAGAHPLLREDFYNSFLAAFSPDEIRQQLVEAGITGATVEAVTDRHFDIHWIG